MLSIYLLRHGETVWNADGNRYCGRTDIGLTERGVQQAHKTATLLKNIEFEAVFSSPLARAYTTARTISGRDDVSKDDRLIEFDFGQWEGKRKEEFIPEDPELWTDWCYDPGHIHAGMTGESANEVIERVDGFFMELIDRYSSGNIMVVAHNGVNRFYLSHKLGMPLRNYRKLVQDNSKITVFELDNDGELTLQRLNG